MGSTKSDEEGEERRGEAEKAEAQQRKQIHVLASGRVRGKKVSNINKQNKYNE